MSRTHSAVFTFSRAVASNNPSSCRIFSILGTRLYLRTLYPALLSNFSRALSSCSLPRWLASSSSITATAANAFVQITKSATFLSNVFRVACIFVSSSAENATCASTTWSGSASTSRKYIGCSFAVRTGFGLIGLVLLPLTLPLFAFNAAASATNTKTASKIATNFPLSRLIVFPGCCSVRILTRGMGGA
jgi:hypothetical protein